MRYGYGTEQVRERLRLFGEQSRLRRRQREQERKARVRRELAARTGTAKPKRTPKPKPSPLTLSYVAVKGGLEICIGEDRLRLPRGPMTRERLCELLNAQTKRYRFRYKPSPFGEILTFDVVGR